MVRLAAATGRAIASSTGLAEIERQHAGMLDQDGVGLADQHGAERGEHEQAEREALHDRAHLAGNYLEVVPDRHVRPTLPQAGGERMARFSTSTTERRADG